MWIGAVLGAAVLVLILDRLLLAAEARGWIFYRKRQASSGSVSAAAFGPLIDLLQPSRQIVVEQQEHQALMREDDANGDAGGGWVWPGAAA